MSVVNETEYLTQGGLAELFRVSVRTMQRLARERGFPRPLRFGRSYRWRKAEVEEFLRKTREVALDEQDAVVAPVGRQQVGRAHRAPGAERGCSFGRHVIAGPGQKRILEVE